VEWCSVRIDLHYFFANQPLAHTEGALRTWKIKRPPKWRREVWFITRERKSSSSVGGCNRRFSFTLKWFTTARNLRTVFTRPSVCRRVSCVRICALLISNFSNGVYDITVRNFMNGHSSEFVRCCTVIRHDTAFPLTQLSILSCVTFSNRRTISNNTICHLSVAFKF